MGGASARRTREEVANEHALESSVPLAIPRACIRLDAHEVAREFRERGAEDEAGGAARRPRVDPVGLRLTRLRKGGQ